MVIWLFVSTKKLCILKKSKWTLVDQGVPCQKNVSDIPLTTSPSNPSYRPPKLNRIERIPPLWVPHGYGPVETFSYYPQWQDGEVINDRDSDKWRTVGASKTDIMAAFTSPLSFLCLSHIPLFPAFHHLCIYSIAYTAFSPTVLVLRVSFIPSYKYTCVHFFTFIYPRFFCLSLWIRYLYKFSSIYSKQNITSFFSTYFEQTLIFTIFQTTHNK